jgi:uncharacterized protein (DUF362 family)
MPVCRRLAVSADEQKATVSRRAFILRSLKAAAALLLTGGIGYYRFDPVGPSLTASESPGEGLPAFDMAEAGAHLVVVKGSDRRQTIRQAFKAMGGLERFIGRGDRVLLKVNAAFASPAILSATTHPDLVQEVAQLCFQAGAASVVITDNPINDPGSCFDLTGIAPAAKKAGAVVVLPREDQFRMTSLPQGQLIREWPVLAAPLTNITKMIGMAPVKDHHRSGASMSMKNWYGLLGGNRNLFHQDIHNIIKELAMLVRPTFVILDGTTTMMTNGPTGGSLSDLKPTHTMIVSTDQVAADVYGASLLNKTVDDLPFLAKAAAAGVGTTDYQSLNPKILSL